MARKARSSILYDGCYAHVFSRSIEGRKIFLDSEDFKSFENILSKVKKNYPFRMYFYCWMQTHFHLAVGIEKLTNFSKAFQSIKWHYTRYFNEKYKRWGPLWRERFKSMLIEDERYMYACGQYIHLNPIKAGMVNRAEDWGYSSASFYEGKPNSLVDSIEEHVIPDDMDIDSLEAFEKGEYVGSEWFKFSKRRGVSVP